MSAVSFYKPESAAAVNKAIARGMQQRRARDLRGKVYNMDAAIGDAATASGIAMLVGQLEKVDPTLNEPLTAVTWQRDIPVISGGGYVNNVSSVYVSYGTSGTDEESFIYNGSTDIAVAQVDLSKETWRTINFAEIMDINLLDQAAVNKIGRSMEQILEDGIRLNYQKLMDKSCYRGFAKIGSYGLTNNPNVVSSTAGTAAAGGTTFDKKTPDEILKDFNTILTAQWEAVGYDQSAMANQIGVPPVQFGLLVSKVVSTAGNISILEYIKRNNLAAAQGIDLQIVPMRQLKGAASSGSADRMVAYRNDRKHLNFEMTMPLGRFATGIKPETISLLATFVAQFSELKPVYPQTIRYLDGI